MLKAGGGFQLELVAELAAAHLPVVVTGPRRVRNFARATGRLAKTDKLDAQLLAQFAAALRPGVRPPRTWHSPQACQQSGWNFRTCAL